MEFHLTICLANRQLCFPYIAVPLVLRVSDIHDFGDQGTSKTKKHPGIVGLNLLNGLPWVDSTLGILDSRVIPDRGEDALKPVHPANIE